VTPSIVLSHVSKVYATTHPVTALRDISLSVDPGIRLAIMGASGSGKSTLLHLMGGLDVVSSGTIAIGGVDLGRLDERERSILRRTEVGFVFQSYHLLPTLTCDENVGMPLRLQGIAGEDVRARVSRALADVGLSDRADHLPDQLSGGERQRTALARALVTAPRLLLADEPTGNLDTATGDQVLALLDEVTRAHGTTLVLVTHNERAAARCDRVVHLRDGMIAGSPSR
jgi:putative ABC transport system ATP-binding protein